MKISHKWNLLACLCIDVCVYASMNKRCHCDMFYTGLLQPLKTEDTARTFPLVT